MNLPLIEMKNVSVTYPNAKVGLKNLNLTVNPGESILVAGSTGSGKSTLALRLMNVIPHLVKAQCEGSILMEGISTGGLPPHRLANQVQLILQNPEAMLFALNVEENIYFGLENLCLDRQEILRRTQGVLELLRLEKLRKRSPLELSGGEQQAASLASVLATDPTLFIMDEPLTYLDSVGKQNFLDHLNKLKASGKSLLILEHRIDLAQALADRIVILREGEKVVDEKSGSLSHETLKKEMGLRINSIFHFSSSPTYSENPSPALEFQDVTFSYETDSPKEPSTPALKNVNLKIDQGELVALLGPNGSGKSTLGTCAMGLDQPQSGTIKIHSTPTTKLSASDRASKMGLLFQRPETQLFCRTVREELFFGGKNLKIHKEVLEARVLQEAKELELTPLLDRHPATLSRGEMRRVALASLLIMRPPILILDEPTVGQDYENLQKIGNKLSAFNREGHTLLVITHDEAFAKYLAHRIIQIEKGEINVPCKSFSNL